MEILSLEQLEKLIELHGEDAFIEQLGDSAPVYASQVFSPDGFEAYFGGVTGKRLTKQGRIWIEQVFSD